MCISAVIFAAYVFFVIRSNFSDDARIFALCSRDLHWDLCFLFSFVETCDGGSFSGLISWSSIVLSNPPPPDLVNAHAPPIIFLVFVLMIF